MRYAWIAEHRQEHGLERMCRVLGVARSGYYAWKVRAPSVREQANQALVEDIRTEFTLSRKTYGAPRIQVTLARKNVACGRHRVARLMHRAGLAARPRRKPHPVTTQRALGVVPAPNLLNQDFTASAPNQKWVCDFTYIATGEGWLYLAVVLDLYSRLVIGWAMDATMDEVLVERALRMALSDRQPAPGLLHHSDQGSQYTAQAYLDCLRAGHSQLSMSRVGNCYDNAVMESFFATVKKEEADRFASYSDAKMALFDYIEVFYNQRRRHSTLGHISPAAFERRAAA